MELQAKDWDVFLDEHFLRERRSACAVQRPPCFGSGLRCENVANEIIDSLVAGLSDKILSASKRISELRLSMPRLRIPRQCLLNRFDRQE